MAVAAATTAANFNDADVTFAQRMLLPHEQAVEKSDDLLAKNDIDANERTRRDGRPDQQALASRFR